MVAIRRTDKRINHRPASAVRALKSTSLLFTPDLFIPIFIIIKIFITFHVVPKTQTNQQKPNWPLDKDYFSCALKTFKSVSKRWPAKRAPLRALGLAQWSSDVVYLPYNNIIPLKTKKVNVQ